MQKAPSSKWIHDQFPALAGFAWQKGYRAFSVGYSSLQNVQEYIEQQHEHHQKHSYKEEFIAFLQKYHIDYDEKYLWDDDSRFVVS